MLIKKGKTIKSRNSQRTRMEDEARYHLRGGIASMAMKTKVTGKPEIDCRGTPLKYSNEMAERHSISQVERWMKGERKIISIPGAI